MRIDLSFPDPDFAESFRAYSNYLTSLAQDIERRYGANERMVGSVIERGWTVARDAGLRPRNNASERQAAAASFNKAWSNLRRIDREVALGTEDFDDESNAWTPTQAYYATYQAIRGLTAAMGQNVPADHRRVLSVISEQVRRGMLPEPWSVFCEGCPQTGTQRFGGVDHEPEVVHPLTNPDSETGVDRLAVLLRTTREKELDRVFGEERRRNVAPGRKWKNLSAARKDEIARRLHGTTVFDVLWRLRKKAHYEDADTFVLGAGGVADAYEFAWALGRVTDASVAAIEGVLVGCVGVDHYREMLDASRAIRRAEDGSPIQLRQRWAHSA